MEKFVGSKFYFGPKKWMVKKKSLVNKFYSKKNLSIKMLAPKPNLRRKNLG